MYNSLATGRNLMNISLGRPMNVSNVQSNLNPVSREGGGGEGRIMNYKV